MNVRVAATLEIDDRIIDPSSAHENVVNSKPSFGYRNVSIKGKDDTRRADLGETFL